MGFDLINALRGLIPGKVDESGLADLTRMADIFDRDLAETLSPDTPPDLRSDPVLENISPALFEKVKDPSMFVSIRDKLIAKGVDREKVITAAQKVVAEGYHDMMVFISSKDQFPGYRRICIMPRLIMCLTDKGRPIFYNRLFGVSIGDLLLTLTSQKNIDKKYLFEQEGFAMNRYSRTFIKENRDRSLTDFFQQEEDKVFGGVHRRRQGKLTPEDVENEKRTLHLDARRDNPQLEDLTLWERRSVRSVISQFTAIEQKKAEKKMGLAFYLFVNDLDEDVRKAFYASNMESSKLLWLSGRKGPSYSKNYNDVRFERFQTNGPSEINGEFDERLKNYRIQAHRLFPWMGNMIYNFLDDIDNGKELIPAIARFYETTNKAVRRTMGLSMIKHKSTGISDSDSFFKIVESMNDGVTFGTKKEMAALGKAHGVLKMLGVTPESSMRKLTNRSLREISVNYNDVHIVDVMDFRLHLEEHVLNPMINLCFSRIYDKLTVEGQSELLEKTYKHRSVTYIDAAELMNRNNPVALMADTARWHREIFSIEETMKPFVSEELKERWIPLLKDYTQGPFTIKELNSEDALYKQGRRENHCVGGYARKIMESTINCISSIYSVERDGKIVATVETLLKSRKEGKKTVKSCTIVQSRAHSNTAPPKTVDTVLESLKTKLKKAPVQEHLDSLGEIRGKANKQKRKNRFMKAGFNPFDEAAVRASWGCHFAYLNKQTRRKGFEGVLEELEQRIMKELEISLPDLPVDFVDKTPEEKLDIFSSAPANLNYENYFRRQRPQDDLFVEVAYEEELPF